MKKLLTIPFILTILFTKAQNIHNQSFENWSIESYDTLDGYTTLNQLNLMYFNTTTANKSTDAFQGNYSIRLETKTNGIDTMYGQFSTGPLGTSGVPYSQNPDSLVGYYKCNVQPGDTAGILITYGLMGNLVHFSQFGFTGTQNTWTRFSFPVKSQIFTPDSIFIGAASSNALRNLGIPGSWLMLDSLHFVGSGITQQLPNLDFENWTTISYEDPDDWSTFNSLYAVDSVYPVTKTTDSYHQNFALKVQSIDTNNAFTNIATSGKINATGPHGGDVYNAQNTDTLQGFYKYSTNQIDSAIILISFDQSGVLSGEYVALSPASTYTKFEIPYSLAQTADSFRIDVIASTNYSFGSELILDELAFKSILTSIDQKISKLEEFNIYPNPANNQLNLEWTSSAKEMNVQIIDGLGRTYNTITNLPQIGQQTIDLSGLSSGIYFLRIQLDGEISSRRFVKE